MSKKILIYTKIYHFILLMSLAMGEINFASAETLMLTPAARLRKLHRIILQKDPSLQDYERLNQVKKNNDPAQLNIYFEEEAANILANVNAANVLAGKMTDIFRFTVDFPENNRGRLIEQSFFKDIILNNKPWRELYTTRDIYRWSNEAYNSIQDADSFESNGIGIYEALVPYDIITNSNQIPQRYSPNNQGDANNNSEYNFDATSIEKIEMAKDDPRLAGIFTLPLFSNRYTTTVLNKNRRRAAAMFRILICKNLKPAVDISTLSLTEALLSESESSAHGDVEKQHGEDPSCAACHSMIDPAGETFNAIGISISRRPSPGAFVLKDDKGNVIYNKPVVGIGGLADAMVETPEYQNCQIDRFWEWYIGSDVNLGASQRKEVSLQFKKLEERPLDFIAYLVNRPEFYTKENTGVNLNNQMYNKVRPILKQCNGCHSNWAPSLNINSKNMQTRVAIAQEINRRVFKVDRQHKDSMPPMDAEYTMGPADRASIKKWLDAGMPDSNGNVIPENMISEALK